ncbi:DUF2155 domain-containing protein [Pseudogemmobacter faecipullorum]|uniref:DUF2155 domain-containing protein n=1 Tax=Pseudogemmobacter faecipullorum TaxID=2755041 RepID=A0ABS8CK21_9RHOB|nr:DUF2155 domain-containing protein [Pseudogemmobacter faecipullorum]MCB5409743.1 DUF2155 domain-containing protein [Pseudogemmobacter faecipullorum]
MKKALVLLGAMAFAGTAATQAAAQSFSEAEGAVLRWLDTLTGRTGDLELSRGQAANNGRLTIQLDSCRYMADNPAAEAEAHLTILDSSREQPVFSGWMLASAPALSAMEHPRYDVWVLRCIVPGYKPPEVTDVPEENDEATDEGAGE